MDFEAVMQQHGPALGRVAASYATGADRDDLLQDIALAVWRALGRFRGESSLRTYVLRIAHNRALAFLARRRTEGQLPPEAPDPRPGPEAALAAGEAQAALLAAVRALPVTELITSGTPSFPYALAYPAFDRLQGTRHRVSPGTVVFHDVTSAELFEDPADHGLTPAAVVFARVVSQPGPALVTCDAGSKSIAAEAGDPVAFVLGRPDLVPRKPSEEHLPIGVGSGEVPARGEHLLLVPRHVCPTVNLAEQAVWIDGDAEPRVVDIAARGHDLLLP